MGQDCKKISNARFAGVTTLKLTNFILLLLDQLHSNKHKKTSQAQIHRGAPVTVIIATQPSGHSREFSSRELDSISLVLFVAFMK